MASEAVGLSYAIRMEETLVKSLSLQINLPKQTTSLSLLNLTHDLIENTAFKNEREKYFTDVSISKFAKDCFKNTTKNQKGIFYISKIFRVYFLGFKQFILFYYTR